MLMAMQSSNAAPERVQQQQQYWPSQQVQMDERDGFILWLRGEFAAANAIINALCHHLKEVGETGEYDGVIGCVEQRRCNWSPVLHMQQYFSVNDVVYALQQVGVRKPRREVKVGARYNKQMSDEARATSESVVKLGVDGLVKSTGSRKAASTGSSNGKTDTQSDSIPDRKQVLTAVPKTFVSNEIYDGKMVNVTDGLRLYEELFDRSVVSKLIDGVNDLRAAGRRGQLQGQTYVVSRRPMKGHGREMIQFGLPVANVPLENQVADLKIEPIPSLFEDVIERLVALEVVSDSVKPDCCIIDIFSEGDYSLPQTWPYWFGWPICVLFLTECDMAFGKVIGIERPGDYKGSLVLSLTSGSMLALEGKSSDFAKHALPSTNKRRILVTFTKSQANGQHYPSTAAPLSSHRAPPPGRSIHIRHPAGPKKYGPVPASGVLTSSTARPTLQSPTGMPPRFVPAAVAPAMPFPAPVLPPVSAGWTAASPRHNAPRLPVPGTGVFLPSSGSGNSVNESLIVNTTNEDTDTHTSPAVEKNSTDNTSSQEGPVYGKLQHQECNGGSVDEEDRRSISMEEVCQNADAEETAKTRA